MTYTFNWVFYAFLIGHLSGYAIGFYIAWKMFA